MAHDSPSKDGGSAADAKGIFKGLLGSVSAVVALFTKRKSRASKKPRATFEPRMTTPWSRPKLLMLSLTSLSNKKLPAWQRRKGMEATAAEEDEEEEDGYGDGGVWQREILMGDKCQPLEFSGVIYYDGNGKQIAELPPRSPRASPFPGYIYDRHGK